MKFHFIALVPNRPGAWAFRYLYKGLAAEPFTSILYVLFMAFLHALVKLFLYIIFLAVFHVFMAALSLRSLRVLQNFPHLSRISDASLYVVYYVDSQIWTI